MAERMKLDKLSCRHWLMLFKDRETGVITAYDAAQPLNCYTSVISKHPTYNFLALRGCESSTSAGEFARAIRIAGTLIQWAEEDAKYRAEIRKAAEAA